MSNYSQKAISEPAEVRRPRRLFFVAVFFTLMTIMTLIGFCAYILFGLYTDSSLNDLNTAMSGPLELPELSDQELQASGDSLTSSDTFGPIEVIIKAQPAVSDESAPALASANPAPVLETEKEAPNAQLGETVLATDKADFSAQETLAEESAEFVSGVADFDIGELVSLYSAIYPGHQIHPKYWDNPLTAGVDEYAYGVAPREDGFIRVSSEDGMPKGTLSDAARILIPSIDIDSRVSNLAILDMGDSKQYETPDHVVGRIPQTSNPGEVGNTWLFGHLESPIMGEGNVFRRLPEIPEVMKNGDPVYVTLVNQDNEQFIYQITNSTVVHRDDLKLSDTDDSTITLVTCVPRLVYDRRLVVSGKLVGVKRPA